jgi:hypothetical protein
VSDLFDDIEVIPDPESPGDTSTPERDPSVKEGPTCEICGTEIPWSGRGRRPKKCDEHKSRTTGRSDTGTPARGARLEKRLATLEADLTREMTLFGKGSAKFLPTFGTVTVGRAPKTAEAMVKIAADHPKVLDALEVATKIMPALDLGETAAMMALALAVDRGIVHPDSIPAVMFGVSETWHDIYPDGTVEDKAKQNGNNPVEGEVIGFPEQQVPPRFARIT